jgi:hypothetical protein
MAGTLPAQSGVVSMKIKLLKHYGMSAPGDVLPDVNRPVADLLISRGIAVLVKKKAKKKCSNTK